MPLPVAIPAALVSHFILDALPHYGIDHERRNKSGIYKTVVYSDAALAIAAGVGLVVFHKWEMLAATVAAFSPDIMLVAYYFRHGHDMDIKADNKFMKFHLGIQHEYPWGIITELLVAAAMVPFFISQLLNS